MNWKMAAKAAGAELKAYKTPQELISAAELHDKGFTDITMASSHGSDKFKHLPWLKVAGKEPPWNK